MRRNICARNTTIIVIILKEVFQLQEIINISDDSSDVEVGLDSRSRRKKGIVMISTRALICVILLIVLFIAAGVGVYFYTEYADQWVSTNNAFVEGRIYGVSVQTPGKLESIHVSESTFVEKGTLLATLDSRLQRLGVKRIETAIRANELSIEKLEGMPEATDELEIAKTRGEELDILLEEAELMVKQTEIFAPASGYVAHLQSEQGEYALPGQPLMSIVNLDDLWVTANFGEDQIRHIRVGQEVEIYVDAYPNESLVGRVDSIMPAGGSAFALFPPDATAGNWVRVVQRIPVKIVFDENQEKNELLLRIGMLARVRVER